MRTGIGETEPQATVNCPVTFSWETCSEKEGLDQANPSLWKFGLKDRIATLKWTFESKGHLVVGERWPMEGSVHLMVMRNRGFRGSRQERCEER